MGAIGAPGALGVLSALDAKALADFLRNPVKAFFSHRLQVRFDALAASAEDDEPFISEGITRWGLIEEVLDACRRGLGAMEPGDSIDPGPFLVRQIDRLQRAGRLPLAAPGRRVRDELQRTVGAMVAKWLEQLDRHPVPRAPLTLRLEHAEDPALVFDDVLSGLRAAADGPPVWIELVASRVAEMPSRKIGLVAKPDKVTEAWVRCLASAACGHPATGIVVGQGTLVHLSPPPADEARDTLQALMAAWRDGMGGPSPWPTAMQTGMAMVRGNVDKARQAYEGSEHDPQRAEVREPCLARLHPDFDALSAAAGFHTACLRLYQPLLESLARHSKAEAWEPDEPDEDPGDA